MADVGARHAQGLEQAVAQVGREVRHFRPTQEQWKLEAGRVAEYGAPGVYHLRPSCTRELAAFQAERPPSDATFPATTAAEPDPAMRAALTTSRQPVAHLGGPVGKAEAEPKKRLRRAAAALDGEGRRAKQPRGGAAAGVGAAHEGGACLQPRPSAADACAAAEATAGSPAAAPSATPSPRALADLPSSASPAGTSQGHGDSLSSLCACSQQLCSACVGSRCWQ